MGLNECSLLGQPDTFRWEGGGMKSGGGGDGIVRSLRKWLKNRGHGKWRAIPESPLASKFTIIPGQGLH